MEEELLHKNIILGQWTYPVYSFTFSGSLFNVKRLLMRFIFFELWSLSRPSYLA